MKILGQIIVAVATSAAVAVGCHLGTDLYIKYKENQAKK